MWNNSIIPESVRLVLSALPMAQRIGQYRWQSPCPGHAGTNASTLKIALSSSAGLLIHCFKGCSSEQVLNAVGLSWTDLYRADDTGRWANPKPYMPAQRTPSSTGTDAKKLQDLWTRALPVTQECPAGLYLAARGIEIGAPAALRWAVLEYWHLVQERWQVLGNYPAMLAQIEAPSGNLAGLHYTYLEPDGSSKAKLPAARGLPVKKVRTVEQGATNGAAIRLYPAATQLVLAEGIETALAVRQALGEQWPVWATVSAGGLERVVLPDDVKRVLIAADHDASGTGQQAAIVAARRFIEQGKLVHIELPEEPGKDWLDALKAGA